MRAQPGDDDAIRAADSSHRLHNCDLVMKGGIASGVVYPRAVARIARTYRICNVGGTSVGAIAAALTAAAEYGRQTGSSRSGFDLLAMIPEDIGGGLEQKFQPQPATKPLFAYLMSIARGRNGSEKTLAALLLGFWPFRLFGGAILALLLFALARSASPGPVSDWLDAFTGSGLRFAAVCFLIVLGFLGGWVAGGLAAAAYWLARRVPNNFMGLCTGLGNAESLTNWLDATISAAAGVHDRVLTFRDLWGTDQYDPEVSPAVNLETLTSDVTRRVGLGMPIGLCLSADEIADTGYYFRSDEWRAFFPQDIVEWLEVNSPDLAVREDEGHVEVDGTLRPITYVAFPAPAHLPVLVAARLSMSFPVLFSAVPVYRKDDPERPSAFRLHWLSDGGLVSNFPIHKFDRALPPWPTFAFDLIDQVGPRPRDRNAQISLAELEDDVLFASGSALSVQIGEMREHQVRIGDLLGFGNGLLNTARGWVDNSQKTLPGYKERIVGIHLYPDEGEGGLNLTMGADMIAELADRGLHGADRLLERWEPGSGDLWDDHRWARYRIIMRELEELGREWASVYDNPAYGAETVAQWVNRLPDPLPGRPYQWDDRDAAAVAKTRTEAFDRFAEAVTMPSPELAFDQPRKPRPNPNLFMIPPFA